MKIMLSLCLLMFIVSCARHDKESLYDNIEDNYDYEDFMYEADAYRNLIEQKLQDLYDLLVLQKQYPAFKDDIELQLRRFSEDSIAIPEGATKVLIENVQQIGELQYISDAVQHLKLRFDMVIKNVIKTDSVTATIIHDKITMDDEQILTTKITFSHIRPDTSKTFTKGTKDTAPKSKKKY